MVMGRVEVKPGPLLAILGLLLLYLLMIARGGGEEVDKKKIPLKHDKTVKNPHPYSYTLNPGSSVCGDGNVDLLVLVASALKHGERRTAVRKTWGAKNKVIDWFFLQPHLFSLGRESLVPSWWPEGGEGRHAS